MQTVLRRPRPCILCTVRSGLDFTSSASCHQPQERRYGGGRDRSESRPPFRRLGGFNKQDYLHDEPEQRSRSPRKRWTKDEDAILRDHYERRQTPQGRLDYLEQQSAKTTFKFNPKTQIFKRPSRRQHGDQNMQANKPKTAPKDFEGSIKEALEELGENLQSTKIFQTLNLEEGKLQAEFDLFKYKLNQAVAANNQSNAHYARLKRIFTQTDAGGFKLEVKYALYGSLISSRFSKQELDTMNSMANLRFPTEWYPATRPMYREIHLHVGPTNSGKTYHALKRLEEAETGLYAGPLRLLAHEVYTRLNARGKKCNLITGDDRRLPPQVKEDTEDANMSSCTVEMIPLNTTLDVAVIDEIQLIGSTDRGWAWTQAVLGVKAKELHLCGEARSVPIITELAALCGDKLHIHRYDRLSPLKMMDKSLDGNLRALQKGDCIVAFSIMEIHGLRQIIEKTLKCKVAIIYGSLPPETRAQQAQLFNDPDSGYDILVASNAIGMGLNLSIKRLIFHTAHRFNGSTYEPLSIAEAKQIAGRAGRYRTAAQAIKKDLASTNLDIGPEALAAEEKAAPVPVTPAVPEEPTVGLVTTLDSIDFPIIERALASDPEPMPSAGIQPPAYIIERFAKMYPADTPFAYLLIRLNEIARTTGRFHLCELKQAIAIADAIEGIPGLTITDKLIFVSSPVEPRKAGETALAQAYARMVADNRALQITDVQELKLELLGDEYNANRSYLSKLETLHKGVIIWMWLSYRFMGVFINRELAFHVKELVEQRIEDTLQRMAFDFDRMRKRREQAIMDMLDRETQAKAENEHDDLEDMPEDPEKMQEWLKKMSRSEHTIEQPSSDLVIRQDEPSADETADESLITALASDVKEEEHEASSQQDIEPEHNSFQFQEEQQQQQSGKDEPDSPRSTTPPPSSEASQRADPNFFL